MTKPKIKNAKTCSYSLDVKVIEMLDKYSEESLIPKTRIIEQAIKEYIEARTNKKFK